ncbi:MAG: radical SAM family heme chaperone HemW [Ruminococcaceae bacterium]|nr:radical SAM family heme chaperone HemW [Oscillospiraceae bacterium]
MGNSLGIYFHIPFCASKCGYCDFYSLTGCDRLMPKYQDALLEHVRESFPAMKLYSIDTVYFGGGTPSYYGAERLCELLNEVKSSGRLLKDAEITVEVNPDSAHPKGLARLRKEGVNRISLGVQSANNDILKIIGRRHNWIQVQNAMRNAREAGFDNISIDLIYGLPSQTKSDWAETLARALELRPEHLSCYALTLEKGTPMYKYKGSPFLPNDDEQADMYLYTVDYLEHYGYKQYEISNFAISGFESQHNLRYWRLKDYLGFGAGAHSSMGGTRFSYVKDADAYICGVLGESAIVEEYEQITPLERTSEYIMLGMRTTKGISASEYYELYRGDFAPIEKVLIEFEEKGWAYKVEDRWRFNSSGFLLSNLLINALLEAQAGTRVAINPWMQKAFDSEEKIELPLGDDEKFTEAYTKKRQNLV